MSEITEIDLDPLYEGLILDYRKSKNKSQWSTKGKIWISTLVSTDCDRKLRFIFDDAPKDQNEDDWPGLESEIGILIHDIIQKSFVEKKGLDKIEKKIFIVIEGVKINMKVDGVFKNGNLLEIKTLGSKDYDLKQPREKDVLQANFYLGITKANSVIITYLKRENGQHIKSFQITFDRERYKKVIMRICNIIKDRNLRVDKRSCRFCQFTKICKEKGYRTWELK